MPDFPIVDAHVHLFDVEHLGYGWLGGVPKINRTHLMPEFDAARGPVAVDKIVFAEVAVDQGLALKEAQFIQSLADKDKRIAGIIAHAPLEKGAAVAVDLEELVKLPALRGIRRLMQGEVDQSMFIEPPFLEGLALVERHGLSFDICIRHWGMVYAIELARRFPGMTFILDHIGKPDIRHGLREPWGSQLRELGRLPNVFCKLSGVPTEADHASWTEAQIAPYVAHAIECFGFGRVMYASDWPVAELTHRYPDWVAILDRILAGATPDEKRKLFRDNAIKAYRL